ncbi:MAG: GntR family transcriptional regulator [bacterium]|jgi:GntR family transcriptional regulator
MYSIDRTLKIPLKEQLANIIRTKIEQGTYRPGERIPSEVEHVEMYGVSRNTVRLAIEQLVAEGLLIKQRPKGVFVAENINTHSFNTILSFSNEMLRLGKEPSAKVLQKGEIVLPRDIQVRYGLLPETMYEIQRLRLADNEPVALERSLVVKHRCPGLLRHDLSKSLYSILQQKYCLRFTHARQRFGSRLLSSYEAKLLGTTPKSEALILSRVTYLPGEQPIEILESIYRGDQYEFELKLNRANMKDIDLMLRPVAQNSNQ